MKKLALIAAVAVLVVAAVWLRPAHDDTVAPPATTATPTAADRGPTERRGTHDPRSHRCTRDRRPLRRHRRSPTPVGTHRPGFRARLPRHRRTHPEAVAGEPPALPPAPRPRRPRRHRPRQGPPRPLRRLPAAEGGRRSHHHPRHLPRGLGARAPTGVHAVTFECFLVSPSALAWPAARNFLLTMYEGAL